MVTRWQREYSCDVCGRRETRLGGKLMTVGKLGLKTQWMICDMCLDLLFEWRGSCQYDLDRERVPTLKWPGRIAGQWAL